MNRFGQDAVATAGLSKEPSRGFWAPAHRLLIPWRAPDGSIVSVQRRVLGTTHGGGSKYIFPFGRPMPAHPFGSELASDILAAYPNAEVAFTESALDALAMAALCRRAERTRVILGLPSATMWRPEWARYARGRRALIATDADAAGDKAVSRMLANLYAEGASSVARCRPTTGKDWGEALEEATS